MATFVQPLLILNYGPTGSWLALVVVCVAISIAAVIASKFVKETKDISLK
jgi:hypothetical protein